MTLSTENQDWYYEDESGQCWYADDDGTLYPYYEEQEQTYEQPDAQQPDQQDDNYQHEAQADDYDYDHSYELVDSESEAVALNCVTDYLSHEGASAEEVPDELAEAAQYQIVALSAMQKSTKGKPRRGKGKGRRAKAMAAEVQEEKGSFLYDHQHLR